MYAAVLLICGLLFSVVGLANPGDESLIPVMLLGFALFFGSLIYLKTKADREKKELERTRTILRKDKAIEIEWARKQSEAEGLDKILLFEQQQAYNHSQGIAAMKTLGNAIGSSAYIEKERNWAVEGGIAQGIGGVAAGVATALDAIQENENIRARNEANKKWAADTKDQLLKQARDAERNRPKSTTMEKLASQYKADLCDSPLTLYGQLQEMNASVSVDNNNAGILMVKVTFPNGFNRQKNMCIDGALRGKVYDASNKLVGCAYLPFPKYGIDTMGSALLGYVMVDKVNAPYKVKIVPINLWRLYTPKTMHLSIKERKGTHPNRNSIVTKLKEDWESEWAAAQQQTN
ncbi:MAG: hypothetical protein IJB69_06280 [Clostridia bacterium]|nr:hypothetical protein [Clostridia bacterium]